MISYILNSLIVSLLLSTCNAASVEGKCSINDEKCLQSYFQGIFKTWTTTGFPEYGIESIEPLSAVENSVISLNDELKIIINKGVATGLGKCIIRGCSIDVNKKTMSYDVQCDKIDVDVTLTLSGSNPLIEKFLGVKELDGSRGHGKITAEKLGLKFTLFYKLVKGNDGKTYFTFPEIKNEHTYEVGNAKVDIDKLNIGDQNMGEILTQVVNSNTNLFLNTFGSPIIDKILEHVIVPFEKVLSKTATEDFISDDLSSYV